MMKKLTLLILAAALSSLSSCQTMQGLGRDVQSAGSGIQNAGNGLENAANR
ncbi:MAG: putative small secreted protein [Akkermansiaceae bacterium]|jgi:predicted small secreted protein